MAYVARLGGIWSSGAKKGIPISDLPVGSLVKTIVDATDTNFRIVHQGLPSLLYDGSCDGTWVTMENLFENRQWHSSNVNDYANSSIHAYLNDTFFNLLKPRVKNAVKQVKIPYRPGSGTGSTVSSGENGLLCKIFLLSGYELGWTTTLNQYFSVDGVKLAYFELGVGASAKNKRVAHLAGVSSTWWTRSPHTAYATNAWAPNSGGDGTTPACSSLNGVRPSFVLPDNARVSETQNPDGSYTLEE
jgi:hypothetical protein